MGLGLSGGSRGLSKLKKLVVGIVSSIKTTMTGNETSTTALLAAKAIYDWAVGKFIDLTKIVTTWTATTLNTNVPSEKLVKDSLDLKADITPTNGATSALRALFIARGYDANTNTYHCVYNTNTGFYEMNGLTDITEAEMTKIYNISMPLLSTRPEGCCQYNQGVRTLYPFKYMVNRYMYCDFMFQSNTNIIIIKSASSVLIPAIFECRFMFYQNSSLTTVDRLNVASVVNFASMFTECTSLTTCYLFNVKAALSFGSSPLLSLESLQYLVTNRANGTTRITITVHPTVWVYLNDAVNYPTWNALLGDAVNNQYIDFASA